MSKINWSKALVDYLKDETQSYASVARKHGVSLQAVKKRASREEWQGLRQKSIQKVNQELPELIGESMADINARHVQIGRALQAVALKVIKEKNLEPENFMQAVRSIAEGVKIERETLDMKEARELRVREVIERDRGIFNTPEMARKYAYKTPITQSSKSLLAVAPVNRPSDQTTSNKPVVDPKLLEQIQERLLQIQENANKLKGKLEAKQADIESSASLSGWH
ncbi:MAG: hypothetical protein AAB492_03625 [Patescibacteria group bacterium]